MSDSNDTQQTNDTSEQNFANLRAQHEAAQRENVFLRAGVDVDTSRGKLLMKGYEGPLDVDAIKAYRTEVFGEPTPETPPPADPPADQAQGQQADQTDPYATEVAGQQAMRDSLAQGQPGAVDMEPPDKNTYDDAMEHFHEDRRKGVNLEGAQLAAIDRVIVAGAEGRDDVIHDPVEWEQRKAEAGHQPAKMG